MTFPIDVSVVGCYSVCMCVDCVQCLMNVLILYVHWFEFMNRKLLMEEKYELIYIAN